MLLFRSFCSSYGVPSVDALVASAARDESGKILALKVVNFAPFPMKTRITIQPPQ